MPEMRLSLVWIDLDSLTVNILLLRLEVNYRKQCRDTQQYSEDKISSKKVVKRYMISHKCIKMLKLLIEVKYGTPI